MYGIFSATHLSSFSCTCGVTRQLLQPYISSCTIAQKIVQTPSKCLLYFSYY
jgi:hypothetical protein